MSYVFDVQRDAWCKIRKFVEDEQLVYLFEELMESIHDANHRVPSENGKHKGDGVNHDSGAISRANLLREHMEKEKTPKDPSEQDLSKLSRSDLVDIVRQLLELLYLEKSGWNWEKSWDIEILDSMAEKLRQHNLCPK